MLKILDSFVSKQVFAIVELIDETTMTKQFLITQSARGWHFPGTRTGLLLDGSTAIIEAIESEIDGIEVRTCKLIGRFWSHGYAEQYYITAVGTPTRKSCGYAAKFTSDLISYKMTHTMRKIQKFYNRYLEKSKNDSDKFSGFIF